MGYLDKNVVSKTVGLERVLDQVENTPWVKLGGDDIDTQNNKEEEKNNKRGVKKSRGSSHGR